VSGTLQGRCARVRLRLPTRRSSYHGMEPYSPKARQRSALVHHRTTASSMIVADMRLMRDAFPQDQEIYSFLFPPSLWHKFLPWSSSCFLLPYTVETVSRTWGGSLIYMVVDFLHSVSRLSGRSFLSFPELRCSFLHTVRLKLLLTNCQQRLSSIVPNSMLFG